MLWFMVFPDVCKNRTAGVSSGRCGGGLAGEAVQFFDVREGVVRVHRLDFYPTAFAIRGFDEQPGGDALFVIEFFAFALDKALLNQDEGDFAAGRDFGDGLVAADAVGEF